MSNNQEPLASIPLPSADLINFRFDAQDKAIKELRQEARQNFDALNHKLDYMVETFVTRSEFSEVRTTKEKEHAEMWAEIRSIKASFKWWATWIVSLMGAVAGVVYTILVLTQHH